MFRTPSTNLADRSALLREFLTSLSPMVGPMSALRTLQGFEFERRGPIWIGLGTAILVKSTIAWLLFWLTTKTFDRCLGRVPESRFRARSRPVAVREDLVPGATG